VTTHKGWWHAEGICDSACPECDTDCGADVTYTVTLEVTVRAATDEAAACKIEDVLFAAGIPDHKFLIITAHG
jgi:hypothetical protein